MDIKYVNGSTRQVFFVFFLFGIIFISWLIYAEPFKLEKQKPGKSPTIQACVDAGGQWLQGECYMSSK